MSHVVKCPDCGRRHSVEVITRSRIVEGKIKTRTKVVVAKTLMPIFAIASLFEAFF